jgi:hypothetical protein
MSVAEGRLDIVGAIEACARIPGYVSAVAVTAASLASQRRVATS